MFIVGRQKTIKIIMRIPISLSFLPFNLKTNIFSFYVKLLNWNSFCFICIYLKYSSYLLEFIIKTAWLVWNQLHHFLSHLRRSFDFILEYVIVNLLLFIFYNLRSDQSADFILNVWAKKLGGEEKYHTLSNEFIFPLCISISERDVASE